MIRKKRFMRLMGRVGLNLFYYGSILFFTVFFIRVFLLASFRIPTDSMSPEILPGDQILVQKWGYGARIFDLFDAVAGKKVQITRMPGVRKVRRNDVVIFHFPYPAGRDRISMDMRRYYVKRCIGLPGDRIEIRHGFYRINGDSTRYYGNLEGQRSLSRTMHPQQMDDYLLGHGAMRWTLLEFGPLKIPRKGENIKIDRTAAHCYQRLIEWEKDKSLTFSNDTLWENGTPLTSYTFTHNYYFMAGDKVENSQDSRYWGLLPDELIVGKAWVVWQSKDPTTKRRRWHRCLKSIH